MNFICRLILISLILILSWMFISDFIVLEYTLARLLMLGSIAVAIYGYGQLLEINFQARWREYEGITDEMEDSDVPF